MHRSNLFFLLIGLALTGSPAAAAERPNIVLVFSDDHAYQAISAYGSRLNRTPHIDRLAVEGARFDRCYVTNSICGPSRAAVLTGAYSHVNGYYGNSRKRFDGSQPTFPKLLREAGYQTAIVGKWHLGSDPTGFDHWDVLVGQGPYYNPTMLANGERLRRTGYTTEIIGDLSLDWLREERDPERPFLLMCQHKAPHRNWQPGPGYLDRYDDVELPEPPSLLEDYSRRGRAVREQDMTIAETMNDNDLKLSRQAGFAPEQRAAWDAAYGPKNRAFRDANLTGDDLVRWKYQRYMKDYLRCVDAVDDQVGRLLDYLDEAGLADNTIVVYASDQGFYLGEHGWFDKRWMYEESLRTPLLVRWPGVAAAGSVERRIVSLIDLAPTFLEAAGVEAPERVQGASLAPLLRGEPADGWRESFYYHYYEYPAWHYVRKHYGVTDGSMKLIHFYEPEVDEWELYDLVNDRDEVVNQFDNPAYAAERLRLEAELQRLRAELKVPDEDPPGLPTTTRAPRVRTPTAAR
ncbi:Arylsulfatase [Pseudobythopirellula maris]|uniref:Arylsulfatase n=1 Tax=Pseudobythopirellula maris TaxID=2527991 RepID=A0A5C5ZNS8_9BACT|nr:sulfatase [Pseudobythopirellula maris]TWT88735.1 Arylsulfatase [Pseudobythopirellula maris]